MGKISNRISAVCLACMAAVSCVYPFEADIEDADSRLVIDGDILIGDETKVSLAYMFSISATTADMNSLVPKGNVWVEDEDGTCYSNETKVPSSGLSTFTIDTRKAPADKKYRLHVKIASTGKEYVSEYAAVNPMPVVDSISYVVNADDVDIMLSAHSDDGGQYFRWTYDEDWEYHADYAPDYKFDVINAVEIQQDTADFTYYWCWDSASSSEVELCATTDLSTNTLVDYKFLNKKRSNPRWESRYRIRVHVRSISENGYRYLDNLNLTSDYTGSLFSPNPSDMQGNLSCVDDPTERVIGYIDVCQSASAVRYIYQSRNNFYKDPGASSQPIVPQPDEDGHLDLVNEWWKLGYVPITYGTDADGNTGVLWDYKRCVDCRLSGGTLKKPTDWEDQ